MSVNGAAKVLTQGALPLVFGKEGSAKIVKTMTKGVIPLVKDAYKAMAKGAATGAVPDGVFNGITKGALPEGALKGVTQGAIPLTKAAISK